MGRLTEYFNALQRKSQRRRTPRPRPQAKRPWFVSAETAAKLAMLPPVPKYLAAAYANLGGRDPAAVQAEPADNRNGIGPLDKKYTVDGLTRRQQKAGRMTQIIDQMRRAYEAGDRAAYDQLVRPFDSAAKAIEGAGWGRMCRELTFPEWTNA